MVTLDGHPLPHGYVIFTPVGFVGAGPIIVAWHDPSRLPSDVVTATHTR